jgi:ATP-dependent Clp protease ATP-binding subunit ClpC
MAERPTLRVFVVAHPDGPLTGFLLRRWDAFFDQPPPSVLAADEQQLFTLLEQKLQQQLIDGDQLERYLWTEALQLHSVDINVYPLSAVNKRPVIGKRRIPLRLSYVACPYEKGGYRLMLPRFGWWLVVEDLSVAAPSIERAVSASLLGEDPHWVYEFRRDGQERVEAWHPDLVRDENRGAAFGDDDDDDGFDELHKVADEMVALAKRKQLPPVYGRQPKLDALVPALSRSPLPSLLLVGEAGVGKTTFVYRLAHTILRNRKTNPDLPARVWRSSAERIIAGMVYLGMWQKRCYDLIEELCYEGDYLYLDRLSSFIQPRSGGGTIAELFYPALRDGEISLILECSERELALARRKAPALLALMTIVRLSPQGLDEAMEQLATYHAKQLPAQTLHPDGLRALVLYLDAFRRDSHFPGKGFHFVDWLARQPELSKNKTLYPADIAKAVALQTGLPEALVSLDRPLPRQKIMAELQKGVIGQDAACDRCAAVIARFKARLNDPNRPIGTLLFVGPTGVGKTELAKQLARYLFADEAKMVRLDMSEYASPGSSLRLMEVGQGVATLAERVRQAPLSLVLLDEIEKAHPEVFDLLLGVLDEGRMVDQGGRVVDFRMTLVVMTSNLGVSRAAQIGFSDDDLATKGAAISSHFLGDVKRHFRPEFFNRLDAVIPFFPLTPSIIGQIVNLELRKAARRPGLSSKQLTLIASDAARQSLASRGYHPTMGARPLKRLIEHEVIVPLAVNMARDPELARQRIHIIVDDDPQAGHLDANQRQRAIIVS